MLEPLGKIMKERPERAVAVTVVIKLVIARFEIDGRETDVVAHEHLGLCRGLFTGLAAPAKPSAARMAQRGKKAHGQATGRRSPPWQGNPVRDAKKAFPTHG